MIIQCFLYIFLFLSYLLPSCFSRTEATPSSGPFKTSIVSVKDCINPRRPYLKNPPMIYQPSIRIIDGKNILEGNLTVLKDIKDVKIKNKCFALRNGKRHQVFSFNNLNCHGAMLHFTFTAIGIKYEKKNCTFMKGFYTFQNLDVNQLQHIWVPSMPYGHLTWRTEISFKDVLFMCTDFDTVTEPAYFG